MAGVGKGPLAGERRNTEMLGVDQIQPAGTELMPDVNDRDAALAADGVEVIDAGYVLLAFFRFKIVWTQVAPLHSQFQNDHFVALQKVVKGRRNADSASVHECV